MKRKLVIEFCTQCKYYGDYNKWGWCMKDDHDKSIDQYDHGESGIPDWCNLEEVKE